MISSGVAQPALAGGGQAVSFVFDVDGAGLDDIGGHTAASQVSGKRADHGLEGGFAGSIRGALWAGVGSRRRGDGDETPPGRRGP